MKLILLLFCLISVGCVAQPGTEAIYNIKVYNVLKEQVMREAADALQQKPITVTAQTSPRSAGGKHDFFSEGDYWWPNPASPDSSYIQRDGMTNPDNFVEHRHAMIRLSRIVGALASAYRITHDDKYVKQAFLHCRAWFVDTATMMSPHLLFAQAIKGRHTGRGIGIIDTIHFIEVVQGLMVMKDSRAVDKELYDRIRKWFEQYLAWLTSHQYGKDEMNATNNHGTCWVMQVAAFATFTHNEQLLQFCRERYKTVLLPNQMAADGSFPRELGRTKPYGYSIFNLDAMVMVVYILSNPIGFITTEKDNLWEYQTPDGKSIKKGIEFLYPYVADKSKWPFKKDVMYWDEWPVAQPFLIIGGHYWQREDWLHTWKELPHVLTEDEVVRNVPIRYPIIWLRI